MTQTEVVLLNRFGPLMTTEEVALVLKFSSANALRIALRRRHLELKPVAIPGRRHQCFWTVEVAYRVEEWVRQSTASNEQLEANMQ